jgi:hypothetical protein
MAEGPDGKGTLDILKVWPSNCQYGFRILLKVAREKIATSRINRED